jgi:hypothetical protein
MDVQDMQEYIKKTLSELGVDVSFDMSESLNFKENTKRVMTWKELDDLINSCNSENGPIVYCEIFDDDSILKYEGAYYVRYSGDSVIFDDLSCFGCEMDNLLFSGKALPEEDVSDGYITVYHVKDAGNLL